MLFILYNISFFLSYYTYMKNSIKHSISNNGQLLLIAIPMNSPPRAAHSQTIQLFIFWLLFAWLIWAYNANIVLDFVSTVCFFIGVCFYYDFVCTIRCFFNNSSMLSSNLLNYSGRMGAFISYCLFMITKGAWKSDFGLQSLRFAFDFCYYEQLLLEVGNKFSSSRSSLYSSQNSCLSIIFT